MLGNSSNWQNVSPLEMVINKACDPNLTEPNYADHLEVVEYVNKKKANTPREAAMHLARRANHRNPHVGILALSLLDTLVQSCGYPFHLQISTKDFLNELVRRFPERPQPFPGPVTLRILDLIHGWKEGICSDSRWKDDFGHIRDMHRLLVFKGYRFRELPRQPPSAAAVSSLKSAEELEEEDRQAQSAKLQELIRRGTPRDLAAAQELMKSLAGANPDAKPDYRTQALSDLHKLEQQVILMNEMLDNADKRERFVPGDAYDQVSSILRSARPKLQKWISDAQTDDPESLDTFLQINDQINTVLGRYEAFQRGDYATSSNPIPAHYAHGSSSSAANAPSLIDLDDTMVSPSTTASGANDLVGILAPNTRASVSPPLVSSSVGSAATSPPSSGFGGPMGPIMLPSTPEPSDRAQKTLSIDIFDDVISPTASTGSGASLNMGTAIAPQRGGPPPPPSSAVNLTSNQGQGVQGKGKDPFADLVGLF